MDTETIELRRKWQIGGQIGSGGFGRVYEALANDGSQAVVKLVPIAPGASRELLFEPIANRPNIVPIIDSGEWQDFYVLVMPRAEKSLRQHLVESGGKLPLDETVSVLIDVAEALAGLEGTVVHRDLKPANILLYQNHWCLADFGIARYAEATTAPDTHKYAFTAAYAAPEQWRQERATSATDVYAFGITAFELLQGHLPFSGPDYPSYRQQHLSQTPPTLTDCPASITAMVTGCLIKAPQARPTPSNILSRLRTSQRPTSEATARLQAANQVIVVKQAEKEAAASAGRSAADQRSELYSAAQFSLEVILDGLLKRVSEAAPSATVARTPNKMARLGDAKLTVDPLGLAPSGCMAAFGRPPVFDVIAYTAISVRMPRDAYGYEGRSHSLWFSDAQEEGIFRWFETAFMVNPLKQEKFSVEPFALPPVDDKAAGAFSPVISARQIAWEPLPFDQGDEEQFFERWLGLFADAVSGTLQHPRHMPEESGGHHRRSE